jgi:arylsulfatase A-like enzyme
MRKTLLALALAFSANLLSAAQPPNIVFIFSDDHSPNAIGAYNRWLKSVNPTPHIDELAAQGMVFERSYCTNSICGPVRAVIETGKHSHLNGFRQNGDQFNWDQQTFPKILQQSGYQTVLYGKYHLEGKPKGYDEWAVLPGQGTLLQSRFSHSRWEDPHRRLLHRCRHGHGGVVAEGEARSEEALPPPSPAQGPAPQLDARAAPPRGL